MSLNFSAAHSSRINKRPRDRNPLLKRSSSLLLNQIPRRKPVSRSQSKPEKLIDEEDFFEDRLHDRGLVISLATDLTLRDIPQNIRYVHSHMFDPIPEKGGMNSTKIAEALNFRRSLPPTVTVAHIHALISSPTVVEREIAELSKAGILRKITIPGRGTGLSSVSDGLILMQDLERLLKEANGLDQQLRSMNRFWRCIAD